MHLLSSDTGRCHLQCGMCHFLLNSDLEAFDMSCDVMLFLMLQPVDQAAAAAAGRPHPSDSSANHTSESSPHSSQSQCSAVQPESALLSALFQLTRSQVDSVVVNVTHREVRSRVATECVSLC